MIFHAGNQPVQNLQYATYRGAAVERALELAGGLEDHLVFIVDCRNEHLLRLAPMEKTHGQLYNIIKNKRSEW
jgi:hypothetical protein